MFWFILNLRIHLQNVIEYRIPHRDWFAIEEIAAHRLKASIFVSLRRIYRSGLHVIDCCECDDDDFDLCQKCLMIKGRGCRDATHSLTWAIRPYIMEAFDKQVSEDEVKSSEEIPKQWVLGGPHHNITDDPLDISLEELVRRSRRSASFQQLENLQLGIELFDNAVKEGRLPFKLQSKYQTTVRARVLI
jgi:hypothetical protein